MRLGFCLAGFAMALAGCSGEAATDLSAKLGCGPVDGLGAITGERSPTYILVGELVETNEAPAAFAELACRLAARQAKDKPLWVGLPTYVGGSTDAQREMRRRLDDLVAKGAPMVIGSASEGHPSSARNREAAELYWANIIMSNVKSVGAGRALLLLPRIDAVAEPVLSNSERYVDYDPMALFLPPGEVVSLELGEANGLDAPTIRIYTRMIDGFTGQIATSSLTPALVTAGPDSFAPIGPRFRASGLSQDMIRYVAESGLARDDQVDVLAAYVEREMLSLRAARIEARRQSSVNGLADTRINDAIPDPFSGEPVTKYSAIARSKAAEELAAWEMRRAEGIPPPFGNPSRAALRQRVPRDLVDLVESRLGYVPN